MKEINKLMGTDYKPFNYYGAPDATDVIIAMGSVSDTMVTVYCRAQTPPIIEQPNSSTFSNLSVIYVPKDSVNVYKTADGWKNYAALTTAGYDACKAIFPEALVIVHIDNAYENNNWFFRKLKQNGGKFDMIGLSHYPMMKQWSGKDWDEMNSLAASNIKLLHNEFNCPVMVVEIGRKRW